MAMNQFPPQAYTRDVLATAYEWLRGQPMSIRELAKDSDSLVALYMQARRRADQKSEQVASTESFKQDLKNLAEGMKQFDDPGLAAGMPQQILPSSPQQVIAPAQVAAPAPVIAPRQHLPAQQHVQQQQYTQHQTLHHAQHHAQHQSSLTHAPQQYAPPPQHVSAPHTQVPSSNPLDHATRDKIRSVQLRMNLSSETEALRMLVAIGYEHLCQWLSKG